MRIDDRPTIAAPDDDPYLWLEEIEGERALDFVQQQTRLTLEKFGGAQFAADRDMLAAIYDRPDNIPYVTRRGGPLYNLWKDTNNPRGLWRRTTLEEFRKPHPEWDVLLDLDRLASDENEDWLLNWIQTPPGNQPRAILSLSRGGSDAVTLREFDTDAKAFVPGGFVLPQAKGGAAWFDADTLLLSSAYGEGMATTSGYGRTIRLWRRGSDVNAAPVIFETAADHMAAYFEVDRTGVVPRVWFVEQLDFFNKRIWLGDEAGAHRCLDLPTGIWMEAHQDWLVVKPRTEWTVAEGHTRRTRCSAYPCRASSPATEISRPFSNRARGVHCKACSGAPVGWCCRSLTNYGRFSKPTRRRQPAGRAKNCPVCPELVSSMSGGSTPMNPKAMATCSRIFRIR
jgi:prolyl oligopeptidase